MAQMPIISDESHITLGTKYTKTTCKCCNRLIPCKVEQYHGNSNDPTHVDIIPLYMPCVICEKWLGHLEEDNKELLSGMCLDCFKEEIEE